MLNFTIIKIIEGITDLSIDEIYSLSPLNEKRYVERKTKRKLTFSEITDYRKISRGNPLISSNRIRTMEFIDKELEKI